MTPLLLYGLVLLAGGVAGFVNTVAGGGSLLTLPALVLLGLPATVANGTNRVAILLQCVVGWRTFRARGVGDTRRVLQLALPTVFGYLAGALIATRLSPAAFTRVIGLVLLMMVGVLLSGPKRWLTGPRAAGPAPPAWRSMLIFVALGVYGGFIQAGIGYFLLAALVLHERHDLVAANALKVGIVLACTGPALVVFAIHGQVDWVAGLVLACGNMTGALIGARMAVEKGSPWILRILMLAITASAVKLLWPTLSGLWSG